MLTGLKGAARNPTALTALRPAGSCNSAVSVYPVSRSLHRAKSDGIPFLIFQCAISRMGRPSFPAWGVSSPHCAASEAGTPGLCQASRAHASPCLPTRCFLPCFSGRARTGRITVWNTRIAAHRTTAHFFRHPHPPRAGAVLVLIQYHATRPGGIAAPPSPATRSELRTQQNILFVAFKRRIECLFERLLIRLSAIALLYVYNNVL